MAVLQHTKPKNFSLRGFILVTRFWNLLIIGFAQYLTAIYLINPTDSILKTLSNPRLGLLVISSLLIAAAGYIINDYYDVKIDLINKPNRVIVGRILKRRVAMVAHTILNFTGIAIGFLLSWQIGVINFVTAVVLWLYSNQLKRIALLGNITVSLLTALSIYVINVLYQSDNVLVILYALFAFMFTLVREIIKDMEDVKGDTTFGCKTLPVVYGLRNTKILVYVISLLCVGLLITISYFFISLEMTLLSVGLFVPLLILFFLLYKADTTKQFNIISNYCKVVMLLGILSMAINV